MKMNKDGVYEGLKNMEILLEKSFTIIPLLLSAVKLTEANMILKNIYDCIPSELKNTECNVYNLLKYFEFTLNNSFPILPNYLVAAKINKLEQLIDQIYATLPLEMASSENINFVSEKCAEQGQPSMEMKLLIFLGQITKLIAPIIPIIVFGIIIVYFFGIDKCCNILIGIINNISK